MSVSDERNHLGVRASVLNLRQSANPLDDLQSRIEEVNGMAATAEPKLFSPLHDGGLEPEPVEPVGEHRASDTGARDEHALDRSPPNHPPDLRLSLHDDVVVIAEFNPEKTQLKYYAPSVGGIRTGWRGKNEKERESSS